MSQGLMDFHEFQRDTKHTKLQVKVRGSLIGRIDRLLQDWDDKIANSSSDDLKSGALSAIILECRSWLRFKRQQKGGGQAPTDTDPSEYARRYRTIKTLANQAVAALFKLDPNLLGAFASFTLNKQRAADPGSKIAGMNQKARAMAGGYLTERAAYLAFNKGRAISSSEVHCFLDDAQMKPDDRLWTEPHQIKALDAIKKKFGHKTFDTLTVQDYKKIGELADGFTKRGIDVKYFTRLERVKTIVQADHEGRLRDYRWDLLDNGTRQWPYAIDLYGNVFFAQDAPPPGYARFNHSTFNAGKEVICAGTMTVSQGQLKMFNNNSGHYKADRTNLSNALIVLKDILLADLSGARIELWGPHPTRQDSMYIEIYTVANFLSGGAPFETGVKGK